MISKFELWEPSEIQKIQKQISDRGGGFPLSALERVFRYSFSTARRPTSTVDQQTGGFGASDLGVPPLAGYGYGLPISRLYARYIAGELLLAPVEGHGCHAIVYLKRDSAHAGEHLPVFNATSARQYESLGSVPVNDWSTISTLSRGSPVTAYTGALRPAHTTLSERT